jgi:hypothetical protein
MTMPPDAPGFIERLRSERAAAGLSPLIVDTDTLRIVAALTTRTPRAGTRTENAA